MGVHGVGRRWRQIQSPHLLPNIPRDERDGRLHCGYHPLGFLDTLHTRLAEVCLLGNSTDRVDVLLEVTSTELAMTTHTTLQVDKMVRVARGCHILLGLLQARCHLGGAAQAALCRLAVGIGEGFLPPLARLFCLRGRLRSGPLFRSERGRDRLAQCMLPMVSAVA